MNKKLILAFLGLLLVFVGVAQVGNTKPIKVKPTTRVQKIERLPTLQDTLAMLTNRIQQLEQQNAAVSKKTFG